MKLSLSTARQLLLGCQGLYQQPSWPPAKEGVAQAIEHLGYVQIDTISVVQRAHHHTLWARCPDYTLPMLHALQAQDRRIFEGWTHAASFIPMTDYRHYRPRMRASAQSPRMCQWLDANQPLVNEVKERLRQEGPLGSSDFKAPPGSKRGSWWDWKPAKQALETLFSMGELMVTERRNFQRIYDLTERVLPSEVDTTEPSQEERTRFVVRRSLRHAGFATADAIRWAHHQPKNTPEILDALVESGELTRVEIEGFGEAPHYALTESLEHIHKPSQQRLHILSPFDNLVIRRHRLQQLFDFQYKLECYLPAAKRRYGYFSLPILWGDRFVARLDSKAERKQQVFLIRRLTFEPDFGGEAPFMAAFAEKLQTFAQFNGCGEIAVEQTVPSELRGALSAAISESYRA